MTKQSVCLWALLALTAACEKHEAAGEANVYKTMVVTPAQRTLTSEYTATLAGQQVVEVRPQVSGLITRIFIGEGDNVHKGQVLFQIDPVPYRAAWDAARANVQNAEAQRATAQLNLESARRLREQQVVEEFQVSTARNALAAAEAACAQARAQEVNARNNLSYTEVKSPVDGVAGMINYRVGALVGNSISEPLVTVSDDRRMYAYFSLTESRITDLLEAYGSPEAFLKDMPDVTFRMSNGKMYGEKGRISAVSGLVSNGTGAVTLRADFPNPNHLLRGGGSGTLIVPSTKDSCIVIPQGATYELQNRTFVYKVVDGKAQSTPVSVFRLNNGTEYVVESGLVAGDVIIAEGAGLVREGAVVNPSKTHP